MVNGEVQRPEMRSQSGSFRFHLSPKTPHYAVEIVLLDATWKMLGSIATTVDLTREQLEQVQHAEAAPDMVGERRAQGGGRGFP